MTNISQNVNIEMLEKLPNGTYKRKYPKTRADDGTTFDDHLADYATLVNRVNNLNINDIQARREILDIKLKLDEMKIVDYLNKTGIGFYDLFTDVDNIDMVNTTATINTSEAEVLFDGLELLKMKEQQFDNFNNLELAIYDKDRETINATESSTNNQIEVLITPGGINVGDKYVYNNAIYTVSTVSKG